VEKRFTELLEIIENQVARDSFVQSVAIVHGKIRMCVVGLMRQIGLLERVLIAIY
jgi:hypothetical protein